MTHLWSSEDNSQEFVLPTLVEAVYTVVFGAVLCMPGLLSVSLRVILSVFHLKEEYCDYRWAPLH